MVSASVFFVSFKTNDSSDNKKSAYDMSVRRSQEGSQYSKGDSAYPYWCSEVPFERIFHMAQTTFSEAYA